MARVAGESARRQGLGEVSGCESSWHFSLWISNPRNCFDRGQHASLHLPSWKCILSLRRNRAWPSWLPRAVAPPMILWKMRWLDIWRKLPKSAKCSMAATMRSRAAELGLSTARLSLTPCASVKTSCTSCGVKRWQAGPPVFRSKKYWIVWSGSTGLWRIRPNNTLPPERACGASLRLDGAKPRPHTQPSPRLLREGFFVYHVGHLGDVASVVPFQHVDQSLHAAAGHAFIGIG